VVLKFNAHLVKCRLKYGLCNPPWLSVAQYDLIIEITTRLTDQQTWEHHWALQTWY